MATQPLWTIALFAGAVATIIIVMLILSYVLGQRHQERGTNTPYESGMPVTGSARGRLSVDYLKSAFVTIRYAESAPITFFFVYLNYFA